MRTTIISIALLLPIFLIGQIKTTYITNDDLPNNAQFGSYVAINEDYAAVGSFYHEDQTGEVSIYKREGEDWFFHQTLVPDEVTNGDWFGLGLSMSDKYLIASAPKDHWVTTEVGKSFVFELVNGFWELDGVLEPASPVFSQSGFGVSTTVFKDEVFITAPDQGFMGEGAVVRFLKNGDEWEEQETFKSPGDHFETFFGRSITVNDDWLAISTVVSENGPVRQEIFLYERMDNGWEYFETIDVPGLNQIVQIPAFTADLYDNQLLVGNYMPPSEGEGLGGIYVYEFDGTSWTLNQTIEPEGFDMQETGRQIAQSENFALVGTYEQDPNVLEPHHMLVYNKSNTLSWELLEDFSFQSSSSLNWQGFVLDMAGDFGIIGTSHGLNDTGEVYIFDFRNAISAAIDLSFTDIDVYPNPFSEDLFIETVDGEVLDYQLFNQSGQIVSSGNTASLSNDHQIAKLPSGMYHLQIKDEQQSYYKKLVKQ